MKKKIICIITARKNSKGIKNKNIKKINGKELIYYPINAARKSNLIDKVVVSTDSERISKISKKFGAEIPFLRPNKYAKDNSPSFDAIKHCLDFFKKNKEIYEYFVLLEPTSPLTTYKDIDFAINMLLKKKKIADALITVSKVEQTHPVFLAKKNHNNLISPYLKKKFSFIRRQDLTPLFFFDGSIYISKVKTYIKKKTFHHNKTLAFELPKYKSIEIDDNIDLKIARLFLSKRGFK